MQRLDRHRGHFYNCTRRARSAPLSLYVSSVDSGNLAGHLLTHGSGLRELADERILTPQSSPVCATRWRSWEAWRSVIRARATRRGIGAAPELWPPRWLCWNERRTGRRELPPHRQTKGGIAKVGPNLGAKLPAATGRSAFPGPVAGVGRAPRVGAAKRARPHPPDAGQRSANSRPDAWGGGRSEGKARPARPSSDFARSVHPGSIARSIDEKVRKNFERTCPDPGNRRANGSPNCRAACARRANAPACEFSRWKIWPCKATRWPGWTSRFLSDPERHLFSVGYNVTERRLDASFTTCWPRRRAWPPMSPYPWGKFRRIIGSRWAGFLSLRHAGRSWFLERVDVRISDAAPRHAEL